MARQREFSWPLQTNNVDDFLYSKKKKRRIPLKSATMDFRSISYRKLSISRRRIGVYGTKTMCSTKSPYRTHTFFFFPYSYGKRDCVHQKRGTRNKTLFSTIYGIRNEIHWQCMYNCTRTTNNTTSSSQQRVCMYNVHNTKNACTTKCEHGRPKEQNNFNKTPRKTINMDTHLNTPLSAVSFFSFNLIVGFVHKTQSNKNSIYGSLHKLNATE